MNERLNDREWLAVTFDGTLAGERIARTYAELDALAARLWELETALAAVGDLHTPIEIEVEQWHDPDAECKAEGECPDDGGCNGHIVTIQSCSECGVGFDSYGEPVHFKWPCRTKRALAGDPQRSRMNAIPRKTSTITRADGTTVEVEHVDHDAVLSQWDEINYAALALEPGDLHNVIDCAVDRLDAGAVEIQRLRTLLDNTACYQALIECKAERDEARSQLAAAVAFLDDDELSGDFPRRDRRDLRRIILGQPPYPVAVPPETPKGATMNDEPTITFHVIDMRADHEAACLACDWSYHGTEPDLAADAHTLRLEVEQRREMTAALRARVAELETQLALQHTSVRLQHALNAIEAARAIHYDADTGPATGPDRHYCMADGEPWPCPTIRALAAVPPETPKETT